VLAARRDGVDQEGRRLDDFNIINEL
jgi:hypothetical protein